MPTYLYPDPNTDNYDRSNQRSRYLPGPRCGGAGRFQAARRRVRCDLAFDHWKGLPHRRKGRWLLHNWGTHEVLGRPRGVLGWNSGTADRSRLFLVPRVGSVLVAGPLLGALLTGLESAAMVGGRSAVAVGLIQSWGSKRRCDQVRQRDGCWQFPSDCKRHARGTRAGAAHPRSFFRSLRTREMPVVEQCICVPFRRQIRIEPGWQRGCDNGRICPKTRYSGSPRNSAMEEAG